MMYAWSGLNGPFESIQSANYLSNPGCPSGSETLVFFPWLPFGLTQNSNSNLEYPADQGYNDAYNCSPANPTFWGWSPYLNLVSEIVSTANANSLRISEYEIETEVNLGDFTVTGRLLYDNTNSEAVLSAVNSILQPSFGNVGTIDAGTASPPSPAYDCGSVYGDSAHVFFGSELLAAMGGAQIGNPSGGTYVGHMLCGGSTSGMITIPNGGLVPTITDNHVYPCVEDLPGPTCDTSTSIVSTAENMYDDIFWFLYYRSLLGNTATIGETDSNNSPPTYVCDDMTSTMGNNRLP